jgi:hypothetical protein
LWDLATPDIRTLREETKRLAAFPALFFVPERQTFADAILLESAAQTNGVAVAVLQQGIAGTAGAQGYLDRVRCRLALINKGL